MLSEAEVPGGVLGIVYDEIDNFKYKPSIQQTNEIPDTPKIPIQNPLHWLKIPDVICVYVDMVGSTRLSAAHHEHGTAKVYRLFTETAIRIFHRFEAPYVDVKGDGVFALFNKSQPYTALVAAVTFKTFAERVFVPKVRALSDELGGLGAHIGIDRRSVLVRKLGLKAYGGRSDRQNEVWAGRPVNMAAKLASEAKPGELLVSDRYYKQLKDRRATHSCGCPGDDGPAPLWDDVDLDDDDRFDFDLAHVLKSVWCKAHGKEFSEYLLGLEANG